jgi:hypothetical protein
MVMAQIEEKPRDITKVKCFNYNDGEHYAKGCFKVRPNFEQNGFTTKANVAKLRPNLILLKFKIKTNVVSYFLNS